jgi:hypothetical protein
MNSVSRIRDKLQRLVLMLSSNQQGEIAAAAHAIERTLKAAGCDWHDFAASIAPQTGRYQEQPRTRPHAKPCNDSADNLDWRAMRQACFTHKHLLRPRELEFVTSLVHWRGRLTEKQHAWLIDIHARVCGADDAH